VGSLAHVLVALGTSEDRPGDESAAFPEPAAGTAAERLERERALADSLARLTDEVLRLRARLDTLRAPAVSPEGP
jgi:hypothetical protein